MKNKRGWIEIVEAFVAILLIAGVFLVILNKQALGKEDISEQIYIIQLSILREIETNTAFRAEIVAMINLPLAVPDDIQEKIDARTPNYLVCTGRVCAISDKCTLSSPSEKDVYAQEVTITSTLETLSYKKLKLFCWKK
jgi:hypothetical protein